MTAPKTMTLDEYQAALRAQQEHGLDPLKLVVICPMCKTLQSAADLIKAGAGKTFDEVEKYLGFSCIGRFTHNLPPSDVRGAQRGCDWTLGGLFQCHTLEVVTPDGQKHPRFEPATPEQAREYWAEQERKIEVPT